MLMLGFALLNVTLTVLTGGSGVGSETTICAGSEDIVAWLYVPSGMLVTLSTVENSLNAAKFTLTNALALERTVAPPPSVRVRVRPVIGTRKVRTSHRGASSTKVN